VVLLIQTILTALINYTIGTLVSVFSFTLSLPSLLYSFAPSWPSAIAFFSVAVVASLSLVATYLALLYAAGGAVVMTTVAFVRNQRRIQGGSGGPEAIGRRSHYD